MAEDFKRIPQKSPPAGGMMDVEQTPEQARQEFHDAIEGSNEVLVSIKAAMQLFPDVATLDRSKLTITRRKFIGVADVESVPVEDIKNVTLSRGPLFSSVKIITDILNNGLEDGKPYEIGLFWHKDALELKRMTLGYAMAIHRHIDCSALTLEELREMLYKFGDTRADAQPDKMPSPSTHSAS